MIVETREKPRLFSVPETSVYSLAEYPRQKMRNQEISIPRTTLAITTAIFSAFPETKKPETLRKLGDLSPMMIALNEAADIGISAEKRIEKGNLRQWQIWGLLRLSCEVRKNLEKRIAGFTKEYPTESKVIAPVIEDFLFLSKNRDEFPIERWPTFLELDSAIFVVTYVGVANLKILQKAGIDPEEKVSSVEDLREKYSILLITSGKSKEYSNTTQQKLRALFASVMLLKTTDDKNDKNGSNVDRILGLPNFWGYAQSKNPQNPEKEIEKIRDRYHEEADLVFPRPYQIGADVLCGLTSVLKAERAKDKQEPQEDPTNFGIFFQRINQTTTLRHELQAAQILSELFH